MDDPVAHTQANGFSLLPAVLPVQEVLEARNQCDREWQEFGRSGRWFGGGLILGHINYAPAPDLALFGRWIAHPTILACIQALLGKEAALLSWGGNLNIPGSAFQPPHTDGLMDTRYLIVNVPLCDVDETNGSTEIYPGSHLKRMSYSEFQRDFRKKAYRTNSKVGDVIVRYPNLWHRGTPNRSAQPRMMMGAIFGPPNPEASPIRLNESNVAAFRSTGIGGRIALSEGSSGSFVQNYFAVTVKGVAKELVCRHAPGFYSLMRR